MMNQIKGEVPRIIFLLYKRLNIESIGNKNPSPLISIFFYVNIPKYEYIIMVRE
jgi:hypothetical protein